MTIKHNTKIRIGRVVSDKMEGTVVVAVERRYSHPLYKKILRRTRKYMAHNENNEAKAGDTVKIAETRPLSKLKRWRVAQIVTRGEVTVLPLEVVEAPAVEKMEPVSEPPAGEIAPAATVQEGAGPSGEGSEGRQD